MAFEGCIDDDTLRIRSYTTADDAQDPHATDDKVQRPAPDSPDLEQRRAYLFDQTKYLTDSEQA